MENPIKATEIKGEENMLRKMNLSGLLNSMDHVMSDLVQDMDDFLKVSLPDESGWKRTETGYERRVEIPGFAKEDLTIEVDEPTETLFIKAKKEDKGDKFVRSSTMSLSYTLPSDADYLKVAASVKNGVCLLTVPATKSENKSRTVPVSIS